MKLNRLALLAISLVFVLLRVAHADCPKTGRYDVEIDSAARVYRDSAGRDSASVADSIARVVPGAPVVPRTAPATGARRDSARRDTSGGVRP